MQNTWALPKNSFRLSMFDEVSELLGFTYCQNEMVFCTNLTTLCCTLVWAVSSTRGMKVLFYFMLC